MLVLAILGPTLLGLVYWGLIASPRYIGVAHFAIRSEAPSGAIDPISALGFGLGAGLNEDTRAMLAYLPSADLLTELDQRINLRALYGAPTIDWMSRLRNGATHEEFLRLWHRRMSIKVDDNTGLLVLEVQGYDPKSAVLIAETVLVLCEARINQINQGLIVEKQHFLERELAKALDERTTATEAVLAYQGEHRSLDPVGQTATTVGTLNALQADLARERVALAELSVVQGDEAEAVKRVKARIAGIEQQAAQLTEAATTAHSAGSDVPANRVALRYQQLVAMASFRTEVYQRMLSAYQQTLVEGGAKLKQVVRVVRPAEPEEVTYPGVWGNVAVLFICCIGTALLGNILVMFIKERSE